jgi:hypothetical protein
MTLKTVMKGGSAKKVGKKGKKADAENVFTPKKAPKKANDLELKPGSQEYDFDQAKVQNFFKNYILTYFY